MRAERVRDLAAPELFRCMQFIACTGLPVEAIDLSIAEFQVWVLATMEDLEKHAPPEQRITEITAEIAELAGSLFAAVPSITAQEAAIALGPEKGRQLLQLLARLGQLTAPAAKPN